MQDIGFLDKRDGATKKTCPFPESGNRIAFLTKSYCCEDYDCETGDLLLNILSMDTYSSPQQFKLFTTTYEACMQEGCRSDVCHLAYCIKVITSRGVDVALCMQFNDSIVFDCITSTSQEPIQVPLLAADKDEIDFIKLDVMKGKGCKMMRIHMQMDKTGSLYWLCRFDGNLVKVFRHNPNAEMGDEDFIQLVYEVRTEVVYFFVFQLHLQKFYLMDATKRIRVLSLNSFTNKFVLEQTLDLCSKDKSLISYTDFDEFTISSGCLHWNKYAFQMIESKAKDNPTWEGEVITIEDYKWVSGPVISKKTGLVLYKQSIIEGDDNS